MGAYAQVYTYFKIKYMHTGIYKNVYNKILCQAWDWEVGIKGQKDLPFFFFFLIVGKLSFYNST